MACGLRVPNWNGCHYAAGEAGGETAVCPKQDYSPEGCWVNIIIYTLYTVKCILSYNNTVTVQSGLLYKCVTGELRL